LSFRLKVMKFLPVFINQVLAEVLAGKEKENLQAKLRKQKAGELAEIAFAQNAVIKLLT